MQLDKMLLEDIVHIWTVARTKAATLVNTALIDAHWQIGQRIVLEEQKGQSRAQYRTFLLKELARMLSSQLGKGLDERDLRRMRQFYQYFPIRDAVQPELTWSHLRLLLRVENPDARSYYMREAADQGWTTRQLERNISSLYFERILVHQSVPLSTPSQQPVSPFSIGPQDVIKDPLVLEFLGLPMPVDFSENELETAILAKLQQFLLELLCKALHYNSYVYKFIM